MKIRVQVVHASDCLSERSDCMSVESVPSGAPSQTTKSACLPPSARRTRGMVEGRVMSVCRIVMFGRGAWRMSRSA